MCLVYCPLLFLPLCCAVAVIGHLSVDSAHQKNKNCVIIIIIITNIITCFVNFERRKYSSTRGASVANRIISVCGIFNGRPVLTKDLLN